MCQHRWYRFLRIPLVALLSLFVTIVYFLIHIKVTYLLDEAKTVTKLIINNSRRFSAPRDNLRFSKFSNQRKDNDKNSKTDSTSKLKSKTNHANVSSETILKKSYGDRKNLMMHQNNHKILMLSDADFRSTSLDEMMSWYGEAEGGGSCQDDFGNRLVNRWRNALQTYCEPRKDFIPHSNANSIQQSKIECYLVHQTRHHGNGDNLCVMKNVSVNLGLFSDDSVVRPVVKNYVDTSHNNQPYIHFPRGFIKGDCTPVNVKWVPQHMPGWNQDWTTSSFQPFDRDSSIEDDYNCDEWVNHSVLIVQRDTFANFFHDSEDFFNVFLAFAILRWKFSNSQIFLTDLYPKGPFWDMWEKVFSDTYPALTAWDITSKYILNSNNKHHEHRVCFRELAVGIYGPAAPITVASWDTPCSSTALVKAYSDFVIRGLNLQDFTHYANPTPQDTITITYLARRSSTEWPEKKYCDDNNSFFLCKLWENWGIRQLGRVIQNDEQVVEYFKSLESKVFSDKMKVKFQDVDYNLLSFSEQIQIDLKTDIMIGPHGAGLMHNIFMRDRGILIELSIDGSGTNRHFHNLARWYGRNYIGVFCQNPVDLKQLESVVEEAIENISIESY